MSNEEHSSSSPDHLARIVMLVYGLMADSKPFWCFVAVKPSRYKELQQLVASKTLDLRSYSDDGYGEIIVSGEGVTPPNDVVQTVAKMFDVPVRKLFAEVDPETEIAAGIEKMKKKKGEA